MRTSGSWARNLTAPIVSAVVLAAALSAQETVTVDDVLRRVDARLEQYFTRAQSIMFVEKTTIYDVGYDLAPRGFGRVLESDLRVEWNPAAGTDAAGANVVRTIRKVNGRAPSSSDDHTCLDPNPISPEPLEFLRAAHRTEYGFTLVGRGKGKDANALLIDFRELGSREPKIEQQPNKREGCYTITFAGTKGRVWIDASTYDVLRIDQHLTSRVDFRITRELMRAGFNSDRLSLERFDVSVRYKQVAFKDPDEALLLPDSIDTLTVYQGVASSHRTHQAFFDYRRFLTGGRLVK